MPKVLNLYSRFGGSFYFGSDYKKSRAGSLNQPGIANKHDGLILGD